MDLRRNGTNLSCASEGYCSGETRSLLTWNVVEMMPATPASAKRFSKFFQTSVTVPS
jgi:hypothetical protein